VAVGRVQANEKYLVKVSNILKHYWEGPTSLFYSILVLAYFFMIFYIAVTFIELKNEPSAKQMELGMNAAGFVVFILVSLSVMLKPLYGMANQAKEWRILVDHFRTKSSKNVSMLLSPNHDANAHLTSAMGLKPVFTWVILGAPMSFAWLYSVVVTYAATIWTVVVLPMISDYGDMLKTDIAGKLNSTLANMHRGL